MAKKSTTKKTVKRRRVVTTEAPVASVVHLASPPNTVPVVVHDPVKKIVTVAHVAPERAGLMQWLFGKRKT